MDPILHDEHLRISQHVLVEFLIHVRILHDEHIAMVTKRLSFRMCSMALGNGDFDKCCYFLAGRSLLIR